MKKLIIAIIIALGLWTLMFAPGLQPWLADIFASAFGPGVEPYRFWIMMSCSGAILTLMSTLWGRAWWKGVDWKVTDLLLGACIAAAMWGIFWVGDKLSQLMFSFARPEVNLIYGMKDGASAWTLSALLLLLIGPAEEIFWRGYVQRKLQLTIGPNTGMVVATLIYALVHVGSLNFMLVMASLTAGACWALLYRYFPRRFGAIIASHAIWDAAVFIWFPIM